MPPGWGVLDTVNCNGDSCDVYYNIFLDPMFVDTSNTDLHLLAGSPCIDAGDPTSPLDPDGTIADLGCYFFDQRMPDIELSTSQLNFGTVTIGETADLPLTIYNVGEGNLILYDCACGLTAINEVQGRGGVCGYSDVTITLTGRKLSSGIKRQGICGHANYRILAIVA